MECCRNPFSDFVISSARDCSQYKLRNYLASSKMLRCLSEQYLIQQRKEYVLIGNRARHSQHDYAEYPCSYGFCYMGPSFFATITLKLRFVLYIAVNTLQTLLTNCLVFFPLHIRYLYETYGYNVKITLAQLRHTTHKKALNYHLYFAISQNEYQMK